MNTRFVSFAVALGLVALFAVTLFPRAAAAQTGAASDSAAAAQQAQADQQRTQEEAAKQAEAAENRRKAGFFAQGNKRGGVIVGLGNSYGNSYLVLGGGLGYYVINGLEVSLDGEAWLFSTPKLYRLSPGVRYTFWQVPRLRPYVGAAYRRTWATDDFPDFNSALGRAGAFYTRGRGYAGIGVVAEKFFDCSGDCTNVYPELLFAISF